MADEIDSGIVIHDGTENVFADLGLADADESEEKVRLAVLVNRAIRTNGLRQAAVAKLLGMGQPEVSRLMNYRLSGISERRLMGFLTALGHDVEIVVRPARGHRASVTVRELESI